MNEIFSFSSRKKQEANEFLHALRYEVEENNIESFDELCESDQLTLVGLLLNALDCDGYWEWYTEHQDSDVVNATLSKMLVSQKKEDTEIFLETIKKNILTYHSKRINKLIDQLRSYLPWEKTA